MASLVARLLIVALGLLVAVEALLAPAARATTAPADQETSVDVRLVRITTDDGVRLDGAYYTPDRDLRRTTGVVNVHGVYDNFYGLVQRFLGPGLASAGYPTLTVNLRSHDHHIANSLFSDTVKDIRAAIDFLLAEGAEQVYLTGHSLGTVSTLYYVVVTQDPRVVALGLYAPHPDIPASQRDILMGPAEYARVIGEVRVLVESGQGNELLLAPFGPRGTLRRVSANTYLSWWAPDAETVPVRWMSAVRVPLLIVYGAEDETISAFGRRHFRENARAVYEAATAAPSRLVRETGGNHAFIGHEASVIRETLDWLEQQGLTASRRVDRGAPPAYRTELVFFRSSDGTPLEGALYSPRTNPKPLAVITTHGTEGNFYSSVAGFLAPGLAERGYTALALNRRDHDDGFARSEMEGGLRDVQVAVDFLAARGHGQVVLAGHSLGTLFVSAYLPQAGDSRIAGVVLSGALADLPARTQEFVAPELYAATLAWAEQAVAVGHGQELRFIPFYTGGQLLTSARAFLSYRVAGGLAAPREQIAGVTVPVLIVHGSNDLVARLEFSQDVATQATAAPSVTLVELRDPVRRGPNEGHGHVGIEAETIATVADWLDARLARTATTAGLAR